ncbi:bifunctional diguanylate cyclase/phosphodiesterase [uncultured Pseudodesulfovibrio sp.]|uniref:GGDEF domain-containing protein n=1 Tax=uncultured Pseudodesulfovibrio sp. TaxID=2035858 RepID=UPI0029C6F0B4|nr:bifunctional diguanylate cyclase/phosphodiesterase [uncultured Pseudodesulfovibrio sp.]
MHMKLPAYLLANKRISDTSETTLILITIKDHSILEEMYGHSFIVRIKQELQDILARIATRISNSENIDFRNTGPGEVALLIPAYDSPADIAYEYKTQAQNDLKRTMIHQTGRGIELGMGYAKLPDGLGSPQSTKFNILLENARRMTKIPLDMTRLAITNRFNEIVEQKKISTLYQPILDFRTGTILGWESLTRGPLESSFRSPVVLFETAEQLGRLFALEKLCRESAIQNAGHLSGGQKLFLNIHPKTMADPEFTPGNTLRLMEKAGLKPDDIVFEITEQHSLQEFELFYQTLEHYRSQGFKIAVDDAGAGYAGLSTIAQLRPEYIKLDKSLTENIHKDPVKRALVETTVTFANKIGSQIIAEGIETKAQAVCIKDIGVHCGQGYFIARPSAPKPVLTKDCQELQSASDISSRSVNLSLPIGDLAQPPFQMQPDNMVSDAQEFFKKNNRFSSIVITDKEVPRGLIMEYHLNRQLSSQYGIALYYRRPIESVMDKTPLIVDMNTPVEQAARKAMKRETLKAYDDIIITRKGILYGIVSVQKLLDAMARIQVEMAKGTNPLTGLPGNVAIEQEVEGRIAQGRTFSIIYADLDHFKVYNDTYGFKSGDRIIKLAADIMMWAARKHASANSCLCHIGGDDFVLITDPESVDRICTSITRCFGRLVKNCYCVEDRTQGWIKAKGRDGKTREYPLVSISLGVISINGQCSLMEIGERAAHIKKYAKSIPGNSVAVDRRLPLGSE